MNTTHKIQKLWEYLGIRDNEILIIRSYNQLDNKDEFIIAEATGTGLEISVSKDMPDLSPDKPFHLIQQRDSSGKFIIPSVEQMIQDEISDY